MWSSFRPPPPDLSDIVEKLWWAGWDRPPGEPHITELLSDPCLHVAFERGGPHAGRRVVGVWTDLWSRVLEGRGLVRAVKLRAGAGQALWRGSAQRLTNRIAVLDTVVVQPRGRLDALECAVLGTNDDEEGIEALVAWVREARAQHPDTQLAVALVERIVGCPEILQVETLSERCGLTPRALQRLFCAQVGASPRWVIRRNRLQEVAARLRGGEVTNLARLSAELGYVDQAHLARDFKRAVGKAPSEVLCHLPESQ